MTDYLFLAGFCTLVVLGIKSICDDIDVTEGGENMNTRLKEYLKNTTAVTVFVNGIYHGLASREEVKSILKQLNKDGWEVMDIHLSSFYWEINILTNVEKFSVR